jgi:hypothetical protein
MMSKNNWEQTLGGLQKDIASIKDKAGTFSMKFKEVSRQSEPLKIAFLSHRLEAQRKSLARTRGYESIMRDRKRLGISLGAAAVGLIFGGIATKDKLYAANTGLSSFEATLQGLGETAWAVSLGKGLRFVPENNVTPGETWVTWDSLKSALARLEKEASHGVKLGNLDSVISRLQKSRELIYFALLGNKPTRLKRVGP